MRLIAEDASSDQTEGADPDHPDGSDPGRGARDDPERMCSDQIILQRRRQHLPLQKRGKAAVYAHVGVSGTFRAGKVKKKKKI